MKYALAVAGLLAVVSLVSAFRISPFVAVFGAVILLGLMVAVVVFAKLADPRGSRRFMLPANVMMWSFLLLTIATAFLLFTCAFFQWPKALPDLTGKPTSQAPSSEAPSTNLINAARIQREARDYAGAWRVIGEAVGVAPHSKAARDEQVEIAMAWLREMRVTSPATFSDAVRPLVDCLYQALPQENGARAADIHAHIGWANALKLKEGVPGRIEEQYAEAVRLDPANPFAHAMWGHFLATQRKPLEQIKEHFARARKSGRAPAFVAYLEIYALAWDDSDFKRNLELLPLANELRSKQINIGKDERGKIFNTVYGRRMDSHEKELLDALPAPDHLATFMWIADGRDFSDNDTAGYYRARLTEAVGDHTNALAHYRAIKADYSRFREKIQAGIQRCKKSA